MKSKINNKYFCWGLTAFLVVAAGVVFYYFVFHSSNIKAGISILSNILMPVVFGLVTAYLLTPILNFTEKRIILPLCNKWKIKQSKKRDSIVRGIGILFTVVFLFVLIYSLFAMLLSQIVPSVQNIVNNFDTYLANITKWLNKLLDDNQELGSYVVKMINKYSVEMEELLNEKVLATTSGLLKAVSVSVISVLKVLWNFIIGLVISIYVLVSKEKFSGQAKKIIYACFRKETANTIVNNFRFTHRTFIGFISGKIVDSIIIGILCFIGTALLHTPYAVLVSVIIGVTNVIPFFGPYLGAVPSVILIFVVDPMHPLNCVYFAIFILLLQQFDGNFLGPKILGNSTGLTGFWVIFAITFFGGLFGVLGMIIGVPIFAVVYAAIKSIVNTALKKKQMSCETADYILLDHIEGDAEKQYEYIPIEKSAPADKSSRTKKGDFQVRKKAKDKPKDKTEQ